MGKSILEILTTTYLIGFFVMTGMSIILGIIHSGEMNAQIGEKNVFQWIAAIVIMALFWPVIVIVSFFK